MGLIWNSTSASGPRQLKALVKSFLFENRKLPEESVANVVLPSLNIGAGVTCAGIPGSTVRVPLAVFAVGENPVILSAAAIFSRT